jgi:hypothetical protein
MRWQTLLLGFLGKAGKSQSKPEEGDTIVTVPGALNLVLPAPFPTTGYFTAAQGQLAPVYSWIYQENFQFNVGTNVGLMVLSAGVWRVKIEATLIEAGAISDATNTVVIRFNEGALTTITATTLTNKQGLNQRQEVEYWFLIEAGREIQFNRLATIGLGTGLNLAKHHIVATRYF